MKYWIVFDLRTTRLLSANAQQSQHLSDMVSLALCILQLDLVMLSPHVC